MTKANTTKMAYISRTYVKDHYRNIVRNKAGQNVDVGAPTIKDLKQ